MTTVFDIKKLEVVLYTNDPQNPQIILKGSMFDDVKGDYPLFTDGVLYSESVINELYGDDHSQKIQTFFNENMFQIFLEQCGKALQPEGAVKIQGCNIKTMLEILFKISYPVPKQVSLVNPNIYSCPSLAVQSIFDEIKKPFIPAIYTHLSLKDKKYTVIDVKWPNTIKTNPDYAMGIIKSLAIYIKEKGKFDELNKNKVEKILGRIQKKYKSSVIFPRNGFLFKEYTKTNVKTELDNSINTLIDKVNELYQSFVFYIYFWLFFIRKRKNHSEAFISVGSNTGIFNMNLNNILDVVVKTDVDTGAFIFNKISPLSHNKVEQNKFKDLLFNKSDNDDKTYCNDLDSASYNSLIRDIETKYESFVLNIDNYNIFLDFINSVESLKEFCPKEQRKAINTYLNNPLSDTTEGKDETAYINSVNAVNGLVSTPKHIMLRTALCDYGFGDDGLYTQIMAIHKTIEVISKFKIDDITTSQFAKTQIESLSKIPKGLFDINNLTSELEEIKSLYEIIEGSSIVESSQTKKSPDRERIWYGLYRNHRWYRSFSETIRGLTQTRRSTNSEINAVLDANNSVNIEALTNLIEGDTEAGIDEINIGQGSRENLPTLKTNLFCILIGGEITDANRRMISCPYKANVLGDLFDNLRFGKNIVFLRTKFIDLSKAIKTAEDKAKQDEAKKNKTRKKQPNNNGIEGLVKQTGLENYNDQGFMENFGQGFMENFGQGFGLPNFSGPANNRVNPEKQQQQKPNYNNTISADIESFIERDFKIINQDATKISNRIRGNTFDNSTQLVEYLRTSIDPKVIKVMETVVSQVNEFDTKPFEKIKNEILKYKGKYNTDYQILNNSKRIEDDSKKEKNYLDMYHTKIMENLFKQLDEELDKKEPRDNVLSSSPRGGGGSKKRLLKKSIRKTLRKAYRK